MKRRNRTRKVGGPLRIWNVNIRRVVDNKEKEISRLQQELNEKNARPTFNLSNLLTKPWDFFA